MEATEIVRSRGHPLVSASHPTTFEITTERGLTETGHCIIGVCADKGAADLSEEFRRLLCHDDASLVTTLSCNGIVVRIRSTGSSAMTLSHPSDLVWRKSGYVCGRTIGIRSDRVAATLPADLIRNLKSGALLVATLTATRPG